MLQRVVPSFNSLKAIAGSKSKRFEKEIQANGGQKTTSLGKSYSVLAKVCLCVCVYTRLTRSAMDKRAYQALITLFNWIQEHEVDFASFNIY